MPLFSCSICQGKRSFFKPLCSDCTQLFALVQANLGQVGLGQLMDTLIATGIPKPKIKLFLDADPQGKGSIMDQIMAGLTNNLAEGMGVKESEMTSQDVRRIRLNPTSKVSTKPIETLDSLQLKNNK